jgi:anti-sigma B factor antagonist
MSALETRTNGDVTIVDLEGRLDVQKSMEIEQSINELINSGARKMVFNLKDVEYLSSSGLRIFIAAIRNLKKNDGSLKLANMTDSVKKIFKVVELIDLFEIYPTVEDAVSSFGK